ncbi:MAG: hypothetical protein AVDCRST_MAG87-3216, partial [uncultured Thermomicrobiales bacterium]
ALSLRPGCGLWPPSRRDRLAQAKRLGPVVL